MAARNETRLFTTTSRKNRGLSTAYSSTGYEHYRIQSCWRGTDCGLIKWYIKHEWQCFIAHKSLRNNGVFERTKFTVLRAVYGSVLVPIVTSTTCSLLEYSTCSGIFNLFRPVKRHFKIWAQQVVMGMQSSGLRGNYQKTSAYRDPVPT